MTKLKKYSLAGKETGEVAVDELFVNAEANGQMIKDYIIAIRANARQWSANTKTRAEVNHSNKKPHAQKGTGKARQGQLSTPQYRGGGRVFGPRPKFDQSIQLNKKEKRAAIRFIIAEKIRENRVTIIDSIHLKEPKTKKVAHFLQAVNMDGARVLFLGESHFKEHKVDDKIKRVSVASTKHDNFVKSLQNIPKVEFSLASNVNGYDLLVARDLVMTEEALQELQQWLSY